MAPKKKTQAGERTQLQRDLSFIKHHHHHHRARLQSRGENFDVNQKQWHKTPSTVWRDIFDYQCIHHSSNLSIGEEEKLNLFKKHLTQISQNSTNRINFHSNTSTSLLSSAAPHYSE